MLQCQWSCSFGKLPFLHFDDNIGLKFGLFSNAYYQYIQYQYISININYNYVIYICCGCGFGLGCIYIYIYIAVMRTQ